MSARAWQAGFRERRARPDRPEAEPGQGGKEQNPSAWGNAGGRHWAVRTQDAQLLQAMAARSLPPATRRDGRRWVSTVDYGEERERPPRSA